MGLTNYSLKSTTEPEPPKEDPVDKDYIHRGIAKRSFNLGWKIDSKFDLTKASAI